MSSQASDLTYQARVGQYIEDVINNPESIGQEDFCKYHTVESQSSGISVTGRKKRATSAQSKQYLVRVHQSLYLKKRFGLFTVNILDASKNYAAAPASPICKVLVDAPYLHCVNYYDCANFTNLGNFKCGRGAYTLQLKGEHHQEFISLLCSMGRQRYQPFLYCKCLPVNEMVWLHLKCFQSHWLFCIPH